MIEFNAKVTNSGRVTIPAKARKEQSIKDGDHVHVVVSKLVEED